LISQFEVLILDGKAIYNLVIAHTKSSGSY